MTLVSLGLQKYTPSDIIIVSTSRKRSIETNAQHHITSPWLNNGSVRLFPKMQNWHRIVTDVLRPHRMNMNTRIHKDTLLCVYAKPVMHNTSRAGSYWIGSRTGAVLTSNISMPRYNNAKYLLALANRLMGVRCIVVCSVHIDYVWCVVETCTYSSVGVCRIIEFF